MTEVSSTDHSLCVTLTTDTVFELRNSAQATTSVISVYVTLTRITPRLGTGKTDPDDLAICGVTNNPYYVVKY